MDITPIVNAILALIATIITTYLVPWLQAKKTEVYSKISERDQQFLYTVAETVATAAQQMFESNEDKLVYAVDSFRKIIENAGYKFDGTEARALIESVVYKKKYGDWRFQPTVDNEEPIA